MLPSPTSTLPDGFNLYLTIVTSQIEKVYASNLSPGPDEPTEDAWPSTPDPAIDLVFWSVQIVKR